MSSDNPGGIVRHGRHAPLEDAADALLFGHLAKITRSADKADVLTPWKERDRLKREMHVSTGVPDASLRSGIFGRVINPDPRYQHLNSVQAATPNKTRGVTDWDSE